MINKYNVYSQYEYFGPDGKTLTNWFRIGSFHKTEDEAKEYIKKMKSLSDSNDKIMKLKHFYEIRYEDITQFPIPTYHYPHKGRPTKEDIKRKEDYYKNFWEQYRD